MPDEVIAMNDKQTLIYWLDATGGEEFDEIMALRQVVLIRKFLLYIVKLV